VTCSSLAATATEAVPSISNVGAVGPVLARLRADDLLADAHTEREQSLPRVPDKLPQHLLHPRWQHGLRYDHGLPDRYGCFVHGGGSPRTLPRGADEAGGTAVKFYELRDNLSGNGGTG
jgi:hypothetical protein